MMWMSWSGRMMRSVRGAAWRSDLVRLDWGCSRLFGSWLSAIDMAGPGVGLRDDGRESMSALRRKVAWWGERFAVRRSYVRPRGGKRFVCLFSYALHWSHMIGCIYSCLSADRACPRSCLSVTRACPHLLVGKGRRRGHCGCMTM
jgi:hypothetical protein